MNMDTAVLVIDVQNDFVHEQGSLAHARRDVAPMQAVVSSISNLVEAARSASVHVIWIRTEHNPWTNSSAWVNRLANKQDIRRHPICVGGTWGAELYQLKPKESEPVVTKHRYSAFVNTDLDLILRSMEIRRLLIAGVTTNVCVESTARDGAMRDYVVTLLADCMAADSAAEHEATLFTFEHYFGSVTNSKDAINAW
jgi:ureidoacrylate peracid hydrolase